MKYKQHRWKILGSLLLLIAALGALVIFLGREPTYSGQPLSYWVHALNSGNLQMREEAAQVLKEVGPEGVDYLSGAARQKPSKLREKAKAISQFFPMKLRAIGRKFFGERSDISRMQAVTALSLISTNDQKIKNALTNALFDQSASVSWRAGVALGARPDAIPDLVAALDSTAINVRNSACLGLQNLGPLASNAVPRLIRILREEPGPIKATASLTLARIGPSAVSELTESLAHTNAAVRAASANALGTMGPYGLPAVPALLHRMNDPDLDAWIAAVRALGNIDVLRQDVDEALMEALRSDSPALRQTAMQALATRGRAVRRYQSEFEAIAARTNSQLAPLAQRALSNFARKAPALKN